MSYTELEHGYQGLRNASRPMFYIGDINTVQPSVIPSIYRSSKRVSLGSFYC
ncbi:hypothetical protein ALC62_10662 [Cyphomyrmex costatus]|uniref:Uncharacterized protein n=1 Tax=Cyphomyrmex costatus TaxID=456900 RepID=A0A195CCV6_9HYME|nr:hypothetical protein ALC62_10662 [Cyphomyrmex costatus]